MAPSGDEEKFFGRLEISFLFLFLSFLFFSLDFSCNCACAGWWRACKGMRRGRIFYMPKMYFALAVCGCQALK